MDRLKTIQAHFPDILIDDRPNIITVQYNRPKALNALNQSIVESLRTIVQDNKQKWILQMGNDKAFSAGADVVKLCHLGPN